MASTFLTFTPSSTQTSNQIGTLSYWVKRSTLGTAQFPWHFYPNRSGHSNDRTFQAFDTSDRLTHERIYLGSTQFRLRTNRLFRDVGAWYHIVLAIDTTQATASNRMKLYVNGVQETDFETATYPPQNEDIDIFEQIQTTIGVGYSAGAYTGYFDGYLAEFYGIDGQQLQASDFGQTDSTGIWKSKGYSGTYGTNGFYLKFSNSGDLGADSSGNANNFTKSGNGRQRTDAPSNVFATMNPLDSTSVTHSEGNLKAVIGTTLPRSTNSTISVSQGKWYCEIKITSVGFSVIGVVNATYNGRYYNASTNPTPYAFTDNVMYLYTGTKYVDGSSSAYGASFTTNDIIGIALNLDDDEITFYKNGSSQGTISKTFTGDYKIAFAHGGSSSSSTLELNAGNPTFTISSGNTDDNGYGNFEYAPPTGYLALCTKNLATEAAPTINDGSAYFQTKTYTGNGVETAITNDGNSNLQPDLIWFKARSAAYYHGLFDSTRGTELRLSSNVTDAEVTKSSAFTSFDSDGFTVGADVSNTTNASGQTFVAWQWKANGGTTSSNTDGSITATLQSNANSGFAIATWSGTGTAGTIGHNLGVAPKLVIVKRRNSPANSWAVQHSDLASDFVTFLNRGDTGGETDSSVFNGTYPTSSVFSVGTHAGTNQSGGTYVGYIFAPITGYSAIGKYTGNGSTNGTFVYTGFRPAFVIYKNISSATDWRMFDNKRNAFNVIDGRLFPNLADAENTAQDTVDFLSNGFKLRATNSGDNGSGNTFVYMCFAENPFVTSGGLPVTAR